MAASRPSAIGRSKWLPSLARSAGAKLTVMRLGGSANPSALSAARTRSRDSATVLSGSPTTMKFGKPPAMVTCTSTSSTSMPWKATVRMRATKMLLLCAPAPLYASNSAISTRSGSAERAATGAPVYHAGSPRRRRVRGRVSHEAQHKAVSDDAYRQPSPARGADQGDVRQGGRRPGGRLGGQGAHPRGGGGQRQEESRFRDRNRRRWRNEQAELRHLHQGPAHWLRRHQPAAGLSGPRRLPRSRPPRVRRSRPFPAQDARLQRADQPARPYRGGRRRRAS